jgi:hypothetical protein
VNYTLKTGYITVLENRVIADFVANNTHGNYPLTVQFTDLSMCNPACSGWAWDFNGDGGIDSIGQNPVFTYNYPLTYSPRLIVSNGVTQDTEIKYAYIVIGPNYSPTIVPAPSNTPIGYTDSSGMVIAYKPSAVTDLPNSTYINGWLSNFTATGNFNIYDFGISLMAPVLHVFGFWIFLIIWLLYLFAVWVRSQDVTLPLVIAVLSSGVFGLLFPKESWPVIIIMLVICVAVVLVRLFKDYV